MAKTILIVDDSESIREVVNFTLQTAGFEVYAAGNGKEAVELLDLLELLCEVGEAICDFFARRFSDRDRKKKEAETEDHE